MSGRWGLGCVQFRVQLTHDTHGIRRYFAILHT
jgi:hypothetical protein